MARSKVLPGPSRLSFILQNLQKQPRPTLRNVKSLLVSLETRNKDYSARRFVKNEIPRLRYANQDLEINVIKNVSSPENEVRAPAQVALEFKDGTTKTLNIPRKASSNIMDGIMEAAGSDRWKNAKATQHFS